MLLRKTFVAAISSALFLTAFFSASFLNVPEASATTSDGYWLVGSDGGVFSFGSAQFYGSTGGIHLNSPIIGITATPNSQGYWLVASDGGIFSFGNARFYGSTGAVHLNKPIVALVPSATGNGYWLIASDGGVFAFGDAKFHGSTGAIHLNKPIVGATASIDGGGYWLVASDGGIFSFGNAKFHGSTGGTHLNKPIVSAMTTVTGNGYWMVASDGGIFSFGDAKFYGSTGNIGLQKPIIGLTPTPNGNGYWMVGSDGGIFSFGDAQFFGSTGAISLNQPIVGAMAAESFSIPASPFSATSFWNEPLPGDTPIDPMSATYAANIQNQINTYYGHVAINTTTFSSPIYTVGPDVPTTAVQFSNCQNKSSVDQGFLDQISAVPIPSDAVASADNDADLVVWQPSTDTVWEMWKAEKRPDGWYACWGGRITKASHSEGIFNNPYGLTASGISVLGGTMRIDELQARQINHAITLSLVNVRRSVYSWPANRTDGNIPGASEIAEGQRFRLDPTLNVDGLNLSPTAKTIAKAMQTYGAVIRDKSGAVTLYAEDPTPMMNAGTANPYAQIFNGAPSYNVMNNFPWDHLQALPMDYGKP